MRLFSKKLEFCSGREFPSSHIDFICLFFSPSHLGPMSCCSLSLALSLTLSGQLDSTTAGCRTVDVARAPIPLQWANLTPSSYCQVFVRTKATGLCSTVYMHICRELQLGEVEEILIIRRGRKGGWSFWVRRLPGQYFCTLSWSTFASSGLLAAISTW